MLAFRRFLFISLLGFLITSCSSTRVIDSWSDQSHQGVFENIFIIGFVNESWDRMLYENTFSARLAEEQIDSKPSHLYALRYDEIERETILEKIRSSGCDAVLLTRLVGQRTRATFETRSRAYNYSQRLTKGEQIDFNTFPRDSVRIMNEGSGVRITPVPQTGTSFIVLTIESLLYDPRTEKLIWSTLIETELKKNRIEIMQNLAEETIRSLRAEGLI